VVEAALVVDRARQCGVAQQAGEPSCQSRLAGCGIAQRVGMRGKTVVVVDQVRLAGARHLEFGLQPMAGDQHDGFRRARQCRGNAAKEIGHRRPGIGRAPLHEEAWPGAVRDEQRGHRCWALNGHELAPVGLTRGSMIAIFQQQNRAIQRNSSYPEE